MTWEMFYAICFVVGLLFSILAFLGGTHLHLPKGFHFHAGHGHAHAGTGRGTAYFNIGTISVFLIWFGGTGFLLTRHSTIWFLLAFAVSTVSGLIGASIVFWFLFKVLLADERPLDPADYDMVGVLGSISSPVRSGGVGEMIFSQEGIRRSASVRSENGVDIPRGTEVVVTDFKKGIAYVRPWEELTK